MSLPAPPSVQDTFRGGRRIILATLGSLGDLHPFIAIALELQARGQEPIIATGECYRQKIERLAIPFRAIRPDCDWVSDPAVMSRLTDMRWGLIRVLRDRIMPVLRDSYDDLLTASHGADLIVSHPYVYAARLLSETTGIAWVSTMHVPFGFFSIRDLSIFPTAPTITRWLRRAGPRVCAPIMWLSKRAARGVAAPWYQLRRELGLGPADDVNPLCDSHSPLGVLAVFSRHFAAPQSDWPSRTLVTGFPLCEQLDGAGLPEAVVGFLDGGTPPIVFTLGSTVAADARDFFEQSAAAARLLGRRAVLVWPGWENRGTNANPADGVLMIDYAPFARLFSRAAAAVHHGGIGTIALAMHAGVPQLVMPCAWDQPDNAERLRRLGVARTLFRRRYRAESAAGELERLLGDNGYPERAAELAQQVRREQGVAAACDALEAVLAARPVGSSAPVH